MFKSAQVLASTTLLCGVLALSGCGASQAGQDAEDTSAHPSASASVKPGTISVASESPSASVAPGSITVVNSASPEHGSLPPLILRTLARRITSIRRHQVRQSTRIFLRRRARAITAKTVAVPIPGTIRILRRIPVLLPQIRVPNSSGGGNGGSNSGDSNRSDNSGKKNAEGPAQCTMDDLNVSVAVTDNSPGARTHAVLPELHRFAVFPARLPARDLR